jgi:putative DNA primase/helicase
MSLIGEPVEQIFVIFLSGGRTGRGVTMETVGLTLGDYFHKAQSGTFTKGDDANTFKMDRWDGKRIIWSDEANVTKFNLDMVKLITGGGYVSVAGKYQDERDQKVTYTPFFTTNTLPKLPNDSATRGRFHISEWYVAPTAEQWDTFKGPDKSERVPDYLYRTSGNGSGILNWLLEGLRDYRENGLVVPEEFKALATDHLSSGDLETQFYAEGIEEDQDRIGSSASAIWTVYQEFYRETHGSDAFVEPTRNAFIRNLEQQFPMTKRGGQKYFKTVRLVEREKHVN